MSHNNTILGMMLALRVLPGSESIRVFGSAATDKAEPGDLDLVLDKTGTTDADRDNIDHLQQALIVMASRNYGLLDPFLLRRDGVLLVRNDMATGWVKVKNARAILKSISTDSVPLVDALTRFLVRPGLLHAPVRLGSSWRGKRARQWIFPGPEGWAVGAGGPRAGEAVAIVGFEQSGVFDIAMVRSYATGKGLTGKAYEFLQQQYGAIRAVEVTPDGEAFQQHMIEKGVLTAMTREHGFPAPIKVLARNTHTYDTDLAV